MFWAVAASPVITGMIGCSPGSRVEAKVLEGPPPPGPPRRRRFLEKTLAQIVPGINDAQRLDRRGTDRRWQGVREEVGPRALPQHLYQRARSRGVASDRAAEGLAEGSRQHVDGHPAPGRRPAPAGADEARRVAIVHHHERLVSPGEVGDFPQWRGNGRPFEKTPSVAIMTRRAPAVPRRAKLCFEIVHVGVAEAEPPRLRPAVYRR